MASKFRSWFTSNFEKKDDDEKIRNPVVRIINVLSENWRGLIGTIPLLFIPIFLTELKTRPDITVKVIWLSMFWLLLIQPVSVPVTGLVPVFAFPCLHVLSSDDVCSRFFNPTMVLLIVGGYLLMLLNNCGFDKRAILCLLNPSNARLTTNSLIVRSSVAAFLLSMCSDRVLVTSAVMEYVNEPLLELQNATEQKGMKSDFKKIRYILCNSVAVSSSIGSVAILNASYAVLAMRTVWEMHGATPDVFNFFQYSVFAFPVAFIMFLLNLAYYLLLIKFFVKSPMNLDSLLTLEREFAKAKDKIPTKISLHEILSIIFLVFCLVLYFFRWSEIIKKMTTYMGWADFGKLDKLNNPQIADATVASLFAILLHIIPRSYNFGKYFKWKLKKCELPPAKAEAGILSWQFLDKNTNYGYILLIGGGVALNLAVSTSGLAQELQDKGSFITNQHWTVGIGVICLVSVLLSNVMTSVAAVLMILPFVLNMVPPDSVWQDKLHLCCLAVGMGCSFGFALPFCFTPPYFVKENGKVPLIEQIKYAGSSAAICFLVLWVALCVYADPVFKGDTRIGTILPP